MRVVALGQLKGGVGKSTVAINLACQATAWGAKAAILDLDTDQGTVEKWGRKRSGIFPVVCTAPLETLRETLARLDKYKCEWVFLDMPGRSPSYSAEALALANLVLIPCRPSEVDMKASLSTARALKAAGTPYAYLLNIAPPQPKCKRSREAAEMLEAAGHPVCPLRIAQRMEVQDATACGKGVNEFAPDGPADHEFQRLYRWIAGHLTPAPAPRPESTGNKRAAARPDISVLKPVHA
jgi:chromosome partitioning protein